MLYVIYHYSKTVEFKENKKKKFKIAVIMGSFRFEACPLYNNMQITVCYLLYNCCKKGTNDKNNI